MSKKKQELVKITPTGKWSIRLTKHKAFDIVYVCQMKLNQLYAEYKHSDDIAAMTFIAALEDFLEYSHIWDCVEERKSTILLQKHYAALLYQYIAAYAGEGFEHLWGIRDALHQKLISNAGRKYKFYPKHHSIADS